MLLFRSSGKAEQGHNLGKLPAACKKETNESRAFDELEEIAQSPPRSVLTSNANEEKTSREDEDSEGSLSGFCDLNEIQ